MNKGELIDKIAKDAKVTKGQASDALDAGTWRCYLNIG